MIKAINFYIIFCVSTNTLYTMYIKIQNRKNFTISYKVVNTTFFSDIGLTKFWHIFIGSLITSKTSDFIRLSFTEKCKKYWFYSDRKNIFYILRWFLVFLIAKYFILA